VTAVPQPPAPAATAPPLRRLVNAGFAARARGESMLWLCAGALVLSLLMILGLLALVFGKGAGTFWPTRLVEVRTLDGAHLLGEVTRAEDYVPDPSALDALPAAAVATARDRLARADGRSARRLLRTGNFELTGEHFRWVADHQIDAEARPEWALTVERLAWGRFYGWPVALLVDGQVVATAPAEVMAQFDRQHGDVRRRWHESEYIREFEIGRLSDLENAALFAVRKAELRRGAGSPAHEEAAQEYERIKAVCAQERQGFEARVQSLLRENARYQLVLRTSDDTEKTLPLQDVVRAYAANRLSLFEQVGVYLARWWEFLTELPRESNSEGGVYPAIFGTVLMTLLMSVVVVPFGVLAALYLREYAKAGLLISGIRIAVNNLAGVPSIVFGVFGLGFFCYIIGGTIDDLLYPERLPSPTFGKGALLWASLTLALLTLPVVIVATEEALAAVPGSMREGSYACGASKWQTIRRIVLPRAMPGIMTGAILAMARGAGEVAPLMLVGAAKKADKLPVDLVAPYLHPSRSFLHLGFHIYDVGFQSQNSEAAKPLVFTTTLLLIGVITLLNVTAIWLRSRLRRRFVGAQF
jgi:phosphate transport system permease protein